MIIVQPTLETIAVPNLVKRLKTYMGRPVYYWNYKDTFSPTHTERRHHGWFNHKNYTVANPRSTYLVQAGTMIHYARVWRFTRMGWAIIHSQGTNTLSVNGKWLGNITQDLLCLPVKAGDYLTTTEEQGGDAVLNKDCTVYFAPPKY